REVLELGPLVVRDANGNGHRDRLFESGHDVILQAAGRPRTSTCGWVATRVSRRATQAPRPPRSGRCIGVSVGRGAPRRCFSTASRVGVRTGGRAELAVARRLRATLEQVRLDWLAGATGRDADGA